jgi:hypothetical protein
VRDERVNMSATHFEELRDEREREREKERKRERERERESERERGYYQEIESIWGQRKQKKKGKHVIQTRWKRMGEAEIAERNGKMT